MRESPTGRVRLNRWPPTVRKRVRARLRPPVLIVSVVGGPILLSSFLCFVLLHSASFFSPASSSSPSFSRALSAACRSPLSPGLPLSPVIAPFFLFLRALRALRSAGASRGAATGPPHPVRRSSPRGRGARLRRAVDRVPVLTINGATATAWRHRAVRAGCCRGAPGGSCERDSTSRVHSCNPSTTFVVVMVSGTSRSRPPGPIHRGGGLRPGAGRSGGNHARERCGTAR